MNLIELSERNRRQHGVYDRLIYRDRIYTNAEMEAMAARLAHHMIEQGIRPGDRVVTMMPNGPEILVAYAAAFKIGATVVPLMFLMPTMEMAFILRDCRPAVVVTSALLASKAIEAVRLADTGTVRAVWVTEPDAPEGTDSVAPALAGGPEREGCVDRADEDVAVLIYTSGTTGRPKGVMQTHGNLIANAEGARLRAQAEGLDPTGEVHLTVLPLAHAYGLLTLAIGYQFKVTNVLLPFFSPDAVLSAIQKHRVCATAMVPTMVTLLLHHPEAEQYDVSSLKKVRCGSAPLPVETLRAFERRFGCTIYEGYGLTETGGILSAHPQNRPTRPGSVGIPMEHVEIRIFDEEDRDVPIGAMGEVVARGPNIMKGYYNLPEATAEAMRGGWFHTGDIGRFDEDGYLHIVDRKKDLIIRGGFNILPAEVEGVLAHHPAVMEAAVIGVKDPVMGEEVKACIVTAAGYEAGRNITEADIIEFCRCRLSHHKVPRFVQFMTHLPKNPVGKVLKKELRAIAAETGPKE